MMSGTASRIRRPVVSGGNANADFANVTHRPSNTGQVNRSGCNGSKDWPGSCVIGGNSIEAIYHDDMSCRSKCKTSLGTRLGFLAVIAVSLCHGLLGCTSTHSATPPQTAAETESRLTPPVAPADDHDQGPREIYPGITLDLDQRHVDVDAVVVGREVEWLELLACRSGTREYESVVAVDADAAQLNIALTLLGLAPGQPARTERDADGSLLFFAPHGPPLELFFVLDNHPAAPIPANQWVIDQETREVMPDNRWVFTGSTIIEFQGKAFFMAEKNGTLISLLNFGDELVSRPTDQSEAGGTDFWTAHTDAIPPIGTKLKLRFQPAAE